MKLLYTSIAAAALSSLCPTSNANTATDLCVGCTSAGATVVAQLSPPSQPSRTAVSSSAVATASPALHEGAQSNCCPQLWSGPLRPMFYESIQPNTNVTQNYGIRFEPTPAFSAQMGILSQFLTTTMLPAGETGNSLHLDAEMVMLNPNSSGQYPATWQTSGPPCAAAYDPQYTPTSVRPTRPSHGLMAWWSNGSGGIWNNGSPFTVPYAAPSSWNMQFSSLSTDPGLQITPNHMKKGKWYVMKLKFKLASKNQDPQSWIVRDVPNCRTRCVTFFQQSTETFKAAPGAPAASMLAFDSQ